MFTELTTQLEQTKARFSQTRGEQLAAIRSKRDELAQAKTAFVPLQEGDARISEFVKFRGDNYLRESGQSVMNALLNAYPAGLTPAGWQINLPDSARALSFDFIAAVDPDWATAILKALIRAVPYQPGSTSQDRSALVERLEAELSDLERAEEALVDDAIRIGMAIEHRQDVQERRYREKVAVERRAIYLERMAQQHGFLDGDLMHAYIQRQKTVDQVVAEQQARNAAASGQPK